MIMNFDDYMKAANEHLVETMEDEHGNQKPYYKKVTNVVLEDAKNQIFKLLQSGLDNEIISKQEYEAMCPQGKTPSKFYCNFKIHKPHNHIPPVRAIISGSGSFLENPSKFVDFHIKDLANKHASYLQDTPDFIRKLEEVNKSGNIPLNAILVTFDVKALFTNIPQYEGTLCTEEALNERVNQKIPTEYIISMLKIILKNNIFSFSEHLYSQQEGTSMGPKHAPHYADIFMARNIDHKIENIFQKYQTNNLNFMKRFLDDIFKILVGTTQDLHKIFDEMNTIHPSIKFTISHTSNISEDERTRCKCAPQDSISFLDTSCKISGGKILLDLHKKSTDRNMYLLPSSCHPPFQHENIPFSLAMRINRICSLAENREQRFQELKDMLLKRGYSQSMVKSAISKARKIPRDIALRKVVKPKHTKRPVAVVSWDPRLPSIDKIQQKHWRSMTLDPYLKDLIAQPPKIANKRQKNIRNYLKRAKLSPPSQTKLQRHKTSLRIVSVKMCNLPYIQEGRELKKVDFT